VFEKSRLSKSTCYYTQFVYQLLCVHTYVLVPFYRRIFLSWLTCVDSDISGARVWTANLQPIFKYALILLVGSYKLFAIEAYMEKGNLPTAFQRIESWQSSTKLATILTYLGRGWEFFSSPPHPYRLWDPPSILYSGLLGALSLGVKRPGSWSWPLTSF
jgi:hypothetical protein